MEFVGRRDNVPPMVPVPGVLVDAAWLAHHRDDVVLADVRWYLDGRDGRRAFESGHIPGAVYVDLDTDLSAPDKGGVAGRHPLPTPEHFADALGRLGIGADDTVVAYDDSGGGTAGRLVWMLRALGQDAALLDGGMRAFDGALEEGPSATREPVHVEPREWPSEQLATADELMTSRSLVDARATERYRGETEPVDARAGHVPGAQNVPWASNLDATTGRLRSSAELRERFERLGLGGDTICYCGSGVSACMDLIALEHAGLGPGRLFVPSWSGWSADPDRPVATGDD
jgi:thiosulfate/3-mercaptopyruvate sulfurtransferase